MAVGDVYDAMPKEWADRITQQSLIEYWFINVRQLTEEEEDSEDGDRP